MEGPTTTLIPRLEVSLLFHSLAPGHIDLRRERHAFHFPSPPRGVVLVNHVGVLFRSNRSFWLVEACA